MDEIKSQVILEADASQLKSAFEELVNGITQTKEQLREYKNDKEKSAELTEKLADQERALTQIIKQNNNVIESSNVSYKQLDDILKDLRKQYKSAADEMTRNDLAPAVKSLNNELKGMDASLGDFKRNVGNYENAIESASRNISESFRSVVQTLPSIAENPERFFMALAQSLPKLISAYKNLSVAQKDAASAGEKQVEIDKAELTNKGALAKSQTALDAAKLGSAAASNKETDASDTLRLAEIAETEVTIASAEADLERIQTAKASIAANEAERQSIEQLMIAEESGIGPQIRSREEYEKYQARLKQLNLEKEKLTELENKETIATERLAAAKARLNALIKENTTATEGATGAQTAAGAAAGTMAAGENGAAVATKGLTAALSSFLLIAVVVLSLVAIFGKDILKWAKNLKIFNSEAKQAARFQKEWNEQMREGHQNAAKQIVDLQIYSQWAQMTTKTDKERTLAAKEVLKVMGSAVTTTNIAKVKNGEFQTSIDNVTRALIRQAQAQAMTNKITEKYKDVVDAYDDLTQAENGKLDFRGRTQRFFRRITNARSSENWEQNIDNAATQGAVQRANERLNKVEDEFNKWLDGFLEKFNPSDLLFSGGKGPDGDNWFSKWELYIKEFELTIKKFQGEYEDLDLASLWKYSEEGKDYYIKMYDEFIEHYSADEKAYREAVINKGKYLKEFTEYHNTLQAQWADATKTEYQTDMDKLEEWYQAQLKIYQNAGEDTTKLQAEYTRRKEDILDKYVDKYRRADMERLAIDKSIEGDVVAFNQQMMNIELQNLQDNLDKEIKEYQRKGMATTELEEHYALESAKIISKYAKNETDTIIANTQKQEQALQRRNEQMLRYYNSGADYNDNMFGKTFNIEKVMAYLGGTTMSGHWQRQNAIGAKENETSIWVDSMNQQIDAMKEVLASGKLIGEEKLAMETALADAERELALGTAEYRMELNEMVIEDASATTQEYMGYVQSASQGLAGVFDDVYSAIESNLEAEVKAGKISEEEAEKRLSEYKDIQAAAAMMNALGSAVGAYNSMASIPYVGPALGAIAAAAALAAGIANVKQILATSKNNINANNSYANAAPSLSEYTPQYVVNATGKDDTDYLANAVSERPIKTYVVSSDVTAAQEIQNQTDSETTW